MKRLIFLSFFIGSTCLCLSWGKCPQEIGLTLDLNQFVGDWYMVAGTPVTGNKLSKCGRFTVDESRDQTFTMRYTAVSHRRNNPVTFNVHGKIDGGVMGTWQLEGSERFLGPFKHIVIAADYSSYFATVVCSEDNSIPGPKFSMIWSRQKKLDQDILQGLKKKLDAYHTDKEVLIVDHSSC